MSATAPLSPLIIAHRGASGYLPEHTLAAYELAIAQGADFIEPDLVPTRDGVLIARHENEISETTDVADRAEFAARRTIKRIDGEPVTGWFTEDFTLAEIKTLRARERLPFRDRSHDGHYEVPTFEEVLDLALRKSRETGRTIGVYPETKHPTYFRTLGLPLEEPLLQALAAAGYRGRDAPVFLQSFETGNLKALRQATDLPLIQLIEDHGRPFDLETATYEDLIRPAGLAEIATYADGIGPNKRLIAPLDAGGRLRPATGLVRDAHQAGLLVHAWTMRSEACFLAAGYGGDPAREITQFIAQGVDGLFCDFPDVAVAARAAWISEHREER
jgi:glycerophosphoryl diester phosphodiesterase